MKHRLCQKWMTAVLALALVLSLIPTAQAAEAPAVSDNYFKNAYSIHGNTIDSYLYENPEGALTRVEYLGDRVIVETYSDSFALLSSQTIAAELPIWGGFFAGEQYNFLIFGQGNPGESDDVEVIRVVKYDQDWNRLGQASIYGANTRVPFDAGSLRCTEAGGILYIHTCHKMYRSDDGLNHQSNLRLAVRERDMQVTEVNCKAGTYTGYVSHSFNQFILADHAGNLVTADHGDGYPRSIILYQMLDRAGAEQIQPIYLEDFASVQTERFPGEIGANNTGSVLGGLAETASGYLIAYAYDGNSNVMNPSQVYLAYIGKDELATADTNQENHLHTTQITHYSNPQNEAALCPTLVSTSLSGGYVMWNSAPTLFWGSSYVDRQPNRGLHYAVYSADGSIGPVQTVPDAALSDCQPILHNGKVVWYATMDSVPVFYTLDSSGLNSTKAGGTGASSTSTFRDVPLSHWASQAIEFSVAQGFVNGYSDGTFHPSSPVTNAHFNAMLARAFYTMDLKTAHTDANWWTPYVLVNDAHGILDNTAPKIEWQAEGTWGSQLSSPISRYDMAQMMYNLLRDKNAVMPDTTQLQNAQGKILDWVSIPDRYQDAVAACYALGLLNGQSSGMFGGSGSMNRAQACTVISRLLTHLSV